MNAAPKSECSRRVNRPRAGFLGFFALNRLRGECHSKTASLERMGHVHS